LFILLSKTKYKRTLQCLIWKLIGRKDCISIMGKILGYDGRFGDVSEELPQLEDPDAQLDDDIKKCWNNCVSRCHNACKS